MISVLSPKFVANVIASPDFIGARQSGGVVRVSTAPPDCFARRLARNDKSAGSLFFCAFRRRDTREYPALPLYLVLALAVAILLSGCKSRQTSTATPTLIPVASPSPSATPIVET